MESSLRSYTKEYLFFEAKQYGWKKLKSLCLK
jgi:hypothetical protein